MRLMLRQQMHFRGVIVSDDLGVAAAVGLAADLAAVNCPRSLSTLLTYWTLSYVNNVLPWSWGGIAHCSDRQCLVRFFRLLGA